MAMALANDSGLILTCRVGKNTDSLLDELMNSTEGKTDCKNLNSDGWVGYERILASDISHYIGKDRIQRLESTNGIVRQQTGRCIVTRISLVKFVSKQRSQLGLW